MLEQLGVTENKEVLKNKMRAHSTQESHKKASTVAKAGVLEGQQKNA